jgi:hypothetical protein
VSTFYGTAVREAGGTILEYDLAQWNLVYGVMVAGAFLMSKFVVPLMTMGGGGSIIHIASQLGSVATPGHAAYCSAKGALIQLGFRPLRRSEAYAFDVRRHHHDRECPTAVSRIIRRGVSKCPNVVGWSSCSIVGGGQYHRVKDGWPSTFSASTKTWRS